MPSHATNATNGRHDRPVTPAGHPGHATFAAWFVSCYLVVYVILLSSGAGLLRQIAVGMFLASPMFVLWMAFVIVRHGRPPARDLAPDEEFGYADRTREKLGTL